ncbi:F-box/WD repeat-containing protein 4 [Ischnura elegans]|uniref:F-box/WD repeat-containing protein 4 n=1 Tax=Ischnura elegans TaxID=197161 RepID=UPI001ED8ADE0|nr:F-box/WD repeat-containing protein 4 [Ischnura elegans]
MIDQEEDEGQEKKNTLNLESLPTDVLLCIFKFCELELLGRISQVCKRFYWIINEDYVWIERAKNILVTNQISEHIRNRSLTTLSLKEKCRIYYNWKNGKYKENIYLRQREKYMPKLVLEKGILWISRGSSILAYKRDKDYCLSRRPIVVLEGQREDVCHFVKCGNVIISGERYGALVGWSANTGKKTFELKNGHSSDVNSVDNVGCLIISGSRDETVKVWNISDPSTCEESFSIDIGDRVCSVALSPNADVFCCGSAGLHNISPLHIFDSASGISVVNLDYSFRNGAGILDVHWETPQTLLSCGYDTLIRLWDIRIGRCVSLWEDPYDSAIYSLASDNHNTFLSGLSQHGRIQLWDKRKKDSIQTYFSKTRWSSPVYGMVFDPSHLFAALDQSLNVFDFSGRGNMSKNLFSVPHTIIQVI